MAREVAGVLGSFLQANDTTVRALEPSADIGHFVRAFENPAIEYVRPGRNRCDGT